MADRLLRLRLVQPLIRYVVNGAARRGLRTRSLTRINGEAFRWLDPEINQFVKAMAREVHVLREHSQLEQLPTFGNQLMVELAIWTTAADRTLRSLGVAPAASRLIVADLGWDIYRRLLKLSSAPFQLLTRDPGKRLRWTIGALLVFPFSAHGKPGYEVRTRREDENLLTHFTNCPPHSFVRRLADLQDDPNALEAFRQSWCSYDWPGADLIANDGKRGHYQRLHTLSHGDPVCDMCWAAHLDAKTDEEEGS